MNNPDKMLCGIDLPSATCVTAIIRQAVGVSPDAINCHERLTVMPDLLICK
jgi:hypothetical protein